MRETEQNLPLGKQRERERESKKEGGVSRRVKRRGIRKAGSQHGAESEET